MRFCHLQISDRWWIVLKLFFLELATSIFAESSIISETSRLRLTFCFSAGSVFPAAVGNIAVVVLLMVAECGCSWDGNLEPPSSAEGGIKSSKFLTTSLCKLSSRWETSPRSLSRKSLRWFVGLRIADTCPVCCELSLGVYTKHWLAENRQRGGLKINKCVVAPKSNQWLSW